MAHTALQEPDRLPKVTQTHFPVLVVAPSAIAYPESKLTTAECILAPNVTGCGKSYFRYTTAKSVTFSTTAHNFTFALLQGTPQWRKLGEQRYHRLHTYSYMCMQCLSGWMI